MAANRYPTARANSGSKSDGGLLTYAKGVLTAMTANIAFYATPIPALTVLSGAIDDYEGALNDAAAAGNGETLVAAKNVTRNALVIVMTRLSIYVNQRVRTSTDDPDVARANALTSGFDVSKIPAPVGELAAPINFQAFPPILNNRPQTQRLRMRYDRDATMSSQGISTQWEWRVKGVDPDAEWFTTRNTAAKITILGLTSGVIYETRCAQIGSVPVINYSVIVEATTL